MNHTPFKLLAAMMAVLLVASPAAAVSQPGLNFGYKKTPNPELHEDTLTIAEWDNGDFDNPLSYYGDDGNEQTLPAQVNQTQDEPVSVRFDKVNADAFKVFPRVSGESNNAHTWLNTSNWTTSTSDATNVTPSLTDSDGTTAAGVPSVKFSTSGMGSGDTATASFAEKVDITSDVTKRVLTWAGNVNSLSTGANIQLRAVDSDGDYAYGQVKSGINTSGDENITDGAGNGIVFQERLSNLPVAGTGDGTMSSITKIEIVVSDADASITTVGLDAEKKSEFTLGTTVRDTDGDGDEDDQVTISEVHNASEGYVELTGVDALGSTFSSAVLHDFQVHNVNYRLQDLTAEKDYRVNFSDAKEYGSYSKKLHLDARLKVLTAIDLSHGTLTLRDEQTLVSERYVSVKVAEGVGEDKVFDNITDSAWTAKTSSYSSEGSTVTLDASVSSGTNYALHMVVLLQDEEADNMKSTSGVSGGPTGQSGGFFSTLFGRLATLGALALGAVGLKRTFIGGG